MLCHSEYRYPQTLQKKNSEFLWGVNKLGASGKPWSVETKYGNESMKMEVRRKDARRCLMPYCLLHNCECWGLIAKWWLSPSNVRAKPGILDSSEHCYMGYPWCPGEWTLCCWHFCDSECCDSSKGHFDSGWTSYRTTLKILANSHRRLSCLGTRPRQDAFTCYIYS